MNEVSETTLQKKWIVVASLEKVPPGSVLGVAAAGRDLVLANVDGTLHCADNMCTHAYALLSDGWLEGGVLECPLHGGRFDITTGKALCAPVTEDLKVYRTRTTGNEIEVLLPEQPT
jgi:nitrite reductase/ring-hydroxylating ferredoxin subunit